MNILKTLLICLLLITTQVTISHAGPQGVSASEAASRVQQQLGGRVLAVETIQRKGKTFHRIKILTRKGVVRVVRVNAANGRFR